MTAAAPRTTLRDLSLEALAHSLAGGLRLHVGPFVVCLAARDPVLAARLRSARRRTAGWGRGVLADVEWGEVERLAERARALAEVAS